jgi:hypothetical protein
VTANRTKSGRRQESCPQLAKFFQGFELEYLLGSEFGYYVCSTASRLPDGLHRPGSSLRWSLIPTLLIMLTIVPTLVVGVGASFMLRMGWPVVSGQCRAQSWSPLFRLRDRAHPVAWPAHRPRRHHLDVGGTTSGS